MIKWVSLGAVVRIQQRMVEDFGGMGAGLRDKGLLESALYRPLQLQHYQDGKCTQYAEMAATYADGIIKNHPFFDANKRTGFQAMELFLGLNGMRLTAKDDDCVKMICGLAANEVDLRTFGQWVKKNTNLDQPRVRPRIPCPPGFPPSP